MNKNNFTKSIMALATLKGFSIDEKWIGLFYNFLNSYFADDESFAFACREVAVHENLYGKQPTVDHFLKYSSLRPKDLNRVQMDAKQNFINKVLDYLEENYHSPEDRSEFLRNLDNVENNALLGVGGISRLWSEFNNPDVQKSTTWLVKALGDAYDNNYSIRGVERILIENRGKGFNPLGILANIKVIANDDKSLKIANAG